MTKGVTVLLLSSLMIGGFLCWRSPARYLPEKVWGVWKTDHARYAGRYLDISEAIFTVGQGGRQLQVFFVQDVDTAAVGPREAFTLHYRETFDSGEPVQTLRLFLTHTDAGPRLQLNEHNGIVWYRESDQPDTVSPGETAAP